MEQRTPKTLQNKDVQVYFQIIPEKPKQNPSKKYEFIG
jgi:hypothetical protein